MRRISEMDSEASACVDDDGVFSGPEKEKLSTDANSDSKPKGSVSVSKRVRKRIYTDI